ncbi:hypothetical protein LY76DRAFT_371930 [Colletotrichum caudatum]|nr:hypothetical protein LY76DRAFT_371930 [Colletotrichum caudatum]
MNNKGEQNSVVGILGNLPRFHCGGDTKAGMRVSRWTFWKCRFSTPSPPPPTDSRETGVPDAAPDNIGIADIYPLFFFFSSFPPSSPSFPPDRNRLIMRLQRSSCPPPSPFYSNREPAEKTVKAGGRQRAASSSYSHSYRTTLPLAIPPPAAHQNPENRFDAVPHATSRDGAGGRVGWRRPFADGNGGGGGAIVPPYSRNYSYLAITSRARDNQARTPR